MDKEVEKIWEGRGPDLHAAIEDAWHTAKKAGAGPGQFTVQAIAIEASNPIHSYVVVIGHGGG